MTLYIRFSDDGEHIRQWSREPFEGAAAYVAAPTPTLEVTQADREAAADYEEHFPPHMGGQVFRDGVADDHPLVAAFARHRIAAIEEVREALEEAARAMAADFQTSETHHPEHVLVPLAAFNAMRGALNLGGKP